MFHLADIYYWEVNISGNVLQLDQEVMACVLNSINGDNFWFLGIWGPVCLFFF